MTDPYHARRRPSDRNVYRGWPLFCALGALLLLADGIPAFAQKQPPSAESGEPEGSPRRAPRGAEPKTAPGGKTAPKSDDSGKDEPGKSASGKDAPSKPAPANKLTKGGDLETPAQRAKKLRDLYAELAASGSADEARKISSSIERLWFKSDSDTVAALMQRSEVALAAEKFDLALNLLNTAVELSPDYAEVWNRRAYAYYLGGDTVRAIGDLRRVLALDPNHYKALEALGQIMKELGNKRAALAALRQLSAVHPFSGADQAVKELVVEVEGQAL